MHTNTPTPAKLPLASGFDYATLGNSGSQKCHTPPPGSGCGLACVPHGSLSTLVSTGSCTLHPLWDSAQGWGQEEGGRVSEWGLCQDKPVPTCVPPDM